MPNQNNNKANNAFVFHDSTIPREHWAELNRFWIGKIKFQINSNSVNYLVLLLLLKRKQIQLELLKASN